MPVDAARGSAPTSRARGRRSTARPAGPLYRQVAQAFKDEILAGAYPVGSQIPTEDDLALRFAVSRYTIRQALRRLREEGLVASRQGSGTIVVSPRISDPHVVHAMSINELVDWASGTRFAIDAIKTALIDGEAAERLGVPPGNPWLTVSGMRRAPRTDLPVCLTEYFINGDFDAVAPLIARHAGPVFPLIEQQFGVAITEVHQEISGVTLSADGARRLGVDAGAVALEVRRLYTLADGRVAQVTINTHPAPQFRHTMTIRRVQT